MSKGREAVESGRSVNNNLSSALAEQCLPTILDCGASHKISDLRNAPQKMPQCSVCACVERTVRVKAFAFVPRGGDSRI